MTGGRTSSEDAAGSATAPGPAHASLRDDLAAAGVPDDRMREVEAVVVNYAMQFGGEFLRRVLRALPRSTTSIALQREILGPDGSFADDAAGVCDRSNLARAQRRIRKRLRKIGPQSAQL